MRLLLVVLSSLESIRLLLEHPDLVVDRVLAGQRLQNLLARLLHLLLLLLLLSLYLLLINLGVGSRLLLESLGVSQCVERVVGGAAPRADASEHDDLGLLALHEGVTQHHGQLGGSEGHVLPLRGLALLRVEGAHALLQS